MHIRVCACAANPQLRGVSAGDAMHRDVMNVGQGQRACIALFCLRTPHRAA
jgi:hypothetical protein